MVEKLRLFSCTHLLLLTDFDHSFHGRSLTGQVTHVQHHLVHLPGRGLLVEELAT